MGAERQTIPGYKILLVIAAVALCVFAVAQLSSLLPSLPKSGFERATGYKNIEELITARIAYQEQVRRQIRALGSGGDLVSRAEAGEAEAQYMLGNLYHYGTETIKVDYAEAMKWLRRAAEQGHAPAMYQVGRMYTNGFGVFWSPREALKWYEKAAEGGYKWAQIHLGEIYMHMLAEKFGAKKDNVKAYFWLSIGAATEDPRSEFVRDRDAAEGRLGPGQAEEVKRQVKEWQASHPAQIE